MNQFSEVKSIYFIGIGGIGMSALARFFKARNFDVSGYDRTATPLTASLESEGIPVGYESAATELPPRADLVIYTPALTEEHELLRHFRSMGCLTQKRSQVLGELSRSYQTIAVAGTHGKTTTSTLLTHLFANAGCDVSAFLGGISHNFNSNCIIGSSDTVIVEADEYDRSFHTLYPSQAILTFMDADHLDIYGTPEEVIRSYEIFLSQIKPGGTLLHRHHLQLNSPPAGVKLLSYALAPEGDKADYRGENLEVKDGSYRFDLIGPDDVHSIKGLKLNIGGRQNVENSVAALALALEQGLDPERLKRALAEFRGVKRRFEYVLRSPELVVIDDYAHHPVELTALLNSARELYPGRKITIAFQPHLFTRTRDLADEFSTALNLADEVLLLNIYPAREEPLPGVTSELLLKQLNNSAQLVGSPQDLLKVISAGKYEVLLLAGAGDIDTVVEECAKRLQKS